MKDSEHQMRQKNTEYWFTTYS